MQIMTASGWKQLQPLSNPALTGYAYPNSRPASNDHGRYQDGFVKYEGIAMSHSSKAFITGIQREVAEMAKDRVARRGHNRFI